MSLPFPSFLLSTAIDSSFFLFPTSPCVSAPLVSSWISASAPLSVSLLLSQLLTVPDSTCVPNASGVTFLAAGTEGMWGGKFNELIHKAIVSHLCLCLAGMRSFVHPQTEGQTFAPAGFGRCRAVAWGHS